MLKTFYPCSAKWPISSYPKKYKEKLLNLKCSFFSSIILFSLLHNVNRNWVKGQSAAVQRNATKQSSSLRYLKGKQCVLRLCLAWLHIWPIYESCLKCSGLNTVSGTAKTLQSRLSARSSTWMNTHRCYNTPSLNILHVPAMLHPLRKSMQSVTFVC